MAETSTACVAAEFGNLAGFPMAFVAPRITSVRQVLDPQTHEAIGVDVGFTVKGFAGDTSGNVWINDAYADVKALVIEAQGRKAPLLLEAKQMTAPHPVTGRKWLLGTLRFLQGGGL